MGGRCRIGCVTLCDAAPSCLTTWNLVWSPKVSSWIPVSCSRCPARRNGRRSTPRSGSALTRPGARVPTMTAGQVWSSTLSPRSGASGRSSFPSSRGTCTGTSSVSRRRSSRLVCLTRRTVLATRLALRSGRSPGRTTSTCSIGSAVSAATSRVCGERLVTRVLVSRPCWRSPLTGSRWWSTRRCLRSTRLAVWARSFGCRNCSGTFTRFAWTRSRGPVVSSRRTS